MKIDKQLGNKLFALSGVDRDFVELASKKRNMENKREVEIRELQRRRNILADTKNEVVEKDKLRAQEEGLLAAEEIRILDRRKQLQGISGAKAAKIIEKEIEIASRSLQMLEERVVSAIEALELSEKRLGLIKSAVEELSVKLAQEESHFNLSIQGIDAELATLKKERDVILIDISKIDDRVVSIYEKIRSRYPTTPVSAASGGSCRSCYRSLPSQLFNLILAGHTRIQCPGCSRLLVLGRDLEKDEAA